mmetsp:Transcript_7434/g.15334  ORF Transcript_7434/g.15334 Transcript_7434/m.15334 type:complete len:85 (+) Transcript_7434:3383-3637(+)
MPLCCIENEDGQYPWQSVDTHYHCDTAQIYVSVKSAPRSSEGWLVMIKAPFAIHSVRYEVEFDYYRSKCSLLQCVVSTSRLDSG